MKIVERLIDCLAFDPQSASDIKSSANFVHRLLQDDSQLKRFANCRGNSINGDLPPSLFLKQMRELGGDAQGQLQRGSLWH